MKFNTGDFVVSCDSLSKYVKSSIELMLGGKILKPFYPDTVIAANNEIAEICIHDYMIVSIDQKTGEAFKPKFQIFLHHAKDRDTIDKLILENIDSFDSDEFFSVDAKEIIFSEISLSLFLNIERYHSKQILHFQTA